MEIPTEEKAKVAIVNDKGEILTLRRSQHEQTRQGELDWPGGKRDPEDPSILATLLREVEVEELPGTKLYRASIIPIHIRPKAMPDGSIKISYSFAAAAEFPEDGIVFGPEGKPEHDHAEFKPQSVYPELESMPKKHKAAVVAGAPVLDRLAQLLQDGQLQPDWETQAPLAA